MKLLKSILLMMLVMSNSSFAKSKSKMNQIDKLVTTGNIVYETSSLEFEIKESYVASRNYIEVSSNGKVIGLFTSTVSISTLFTGRSHKNLRKLIHAIKSKISQDQYVIFKFNEKSPFSSTVKAIKKFYSFNI